MRISGRKYVIEFDLHEMGTMTYKRNCGRQVYVEVNLILTRIKWLVWLNFTFINVVRFYYLVYDTALRKGNSKFTATLYAVVTSQKSHKEYTVSFLLTRFLLLPQVLHYSTLVFYSLAVDFNSQLFGKSL